MEMVIAVPRDADNNLTNLYTGYDFSAGKAALVQANPPIGYVFRGDPSTAAFATMRQPTARPPVTPSVQSAVMDGHVGALHTIRTSTAAGSFACAGLYLHDQPHRFL